MLKENREEINYDSIIENIVKDLERKGYNEIKASLENYDHPTKLKRRQDNAEFMPDITAVKYGNKHYFEIARKTEQEIKLVGKWQLLSTLSEMKNGKFRVYVPHGSMRFTNDILKKYDIHADVVKI